MNAPTNRGHPSVLIEPLFYQIMGGVVCSRVDPSCDRWISVTDNHHHQIPRNTGVNQTSHDGMPERVSEAFYLSYRPSLVALEPLRHRVTDSLTSLVLHRWSSFTPS